MQIELTDRQALLVADALYQQNKRMKEIETYLINHGASESLVNVGEGNPIYEELKMLADLMMSKRSY